MPHQCVHCGKVIDIGSKEILDGCNSCHGKFFFYIRDEMLAKIKAEKSKPLEEFSKLEKEEVEADVRTILKVEDEEDPVVLDIESVRVLGPGKFEIDLVSLMNRRPIVFKLEEGKYMIDIDSSMPTKKEDAKS